MAHFTFVIPANKEDLLRSKINDEYKVNNVSLQKDIPKELKVCRQSLREEGAEYILDSFDTYFSVLHHGDILSLDLIFRSYEDLHKGVVELNKALGFLLDDKESLNEEMKLKYLNILKMLIYLYTQMILQLEKRNAAKREQQISVPKSRKKSTKELEEEFEVDKKNILIILYNIIQRDINIFWDSQVIEESFINLISAIAYEFLQNPAVKKQNEVLTEIFNFLGYLLTSYNHGTTFIIRITQLLKLHEHLVQCVPKGIQQLVQNFSSKGLLHELIEELTEWQTDEKHQDGQGARNCATVLSTLAALMPDLMMPEVVSLNNYLYHEPPSLRISVIMVIVEVILNNLTSNDLSDEQKQFRDELFDMILEHTEDNSVLVRAKVFQQLARLQKEMAIPLKFQLQVLEKAVEHLCDKGSLSRKCAINCVTTFLTCNAFSANLSLSSIREELEKHKNLLKTTKGKFEDPKMEQIMKLQAQWNDIVEPLKNVVEKELGRDKENESEHKKIPPNKAQEVIKIYLEDSKFKEAFNVCRMAIKDNAFIEKFKERSSIEDLDFYMGIFYTIFFNVSKIVGQMENQEFVKVTEEDLRNMENLSSKIDFLKQCVEFLETIDAAIDVCVELLETTSVSDMQEAIEFFVAAYQFNIDRATEGILAMLRVMQRTEQERKDAIIGAFKNIYLLSDSKNLTDHCSVVVQRLICLIKSLPATNLDDLQEILSDWIAKGTLDNSVIDMLWQIVTQRVTTKVEDEIAAVVLLKMAATGRKTIISKNLNLTTNIAFNERGKNNLQFLAVCCRLLSVAYEKVDVNSQNFSFRIKPTEDCFVNLCNILSKMFFKSSPFYHEALYAGLDFVYKLSSKPEIFVEQLLQNIIPKFSAKLEEDPDLEVPQYALIRICQLCGCVAIKQLEYMDDTVYKELKRRQNVRDERKKQKKSLTDVNKIGKRKKKISLTATRASEASLSNITVSATDDDTIMEGAQAEDTDADFILNILEKNIVTGNGFLAQLAPIIIQICERPDIYETEELQFAGVTALARYMLVSSEFCQKQIRLLFTIFEKTNYPGIKENILIHLSDLLTRFPNIIEPWTDRLFQRLNDPLPEVRRSSFFIISRLILGDMIRAHSHIPKMALCLANEDADLRTMCKTFFLKLSHKENNLYNALPDIFSHFIDTGIDDEGLRNTMKILLDMVENAKHLENVISRFCTKFQHTEDKRQQRHISYCLTLIKYNDKALRRLIEEFPTYKHLVSDEEIYSNFKTIIQNCSKQQVGKTDLKPIATELETLIKSVFELREDGNMPPPPVPKSVKKRSRPVKKIKEKRKKKQLSDSDDSD
ncbi:condensin complex subunit 1 [Diorhabda carinulata]|uniref:condensin complex subunit 1 n=1 Tax=Diorhabda carinulata TaxID=1163345 RepID=UPI0025A0DBEB|nr:condensin complex subunit 1 [Diorhabda carinulata]